MPRNDGFAVGDRFRDTQRNQELRVTAVGDANVLVMYGDRETRITKRQMHNALVDDKLERLE